MQRTPRRFAGSIKRRECFRQTTVAWVPDWGGMLSYHHQEGVCISMEGEREEKVPIGIARSTVEAVLQLQCK